MQSIGCFAEALLGKRKQRGPVGDDSTAGVEGAK
jgi:hypothetical protein